MSRKYRLRKDTPNGKAGDEYVYTKSGGSYAYFKNGDPISPYWYYVNHVENNPEWFEEVKEPIKVMSIAYTKDGVYVSLSHQIGTKHGPDLKIAIENALNNPQGKLYTQEEVNLIIRNTINQVYISKLL